MCISNLKNGSQYDNARACVVFVASVVLDNTQLDQGSIRALYLLKIILWTRFTKQWFSHIWSSTYCNNVYIVCNSDCLQALFTVFVAMLYTNFLL